MIAVKTLKEVVFDGKSYPPGTVLTVNEPEMVERWIEGGYAELFDPEKAKTPEPETASVSKGERAVPKKAEPKRVGSKLTG